MSKKIIFTVVFLVVSAVLSGCAITFKKAPPALDSGVFKSFDKGEQWLHKVAIPSVTADRPNIADVSVLDMWFDPNDYNAIYLATRDNGLFYTYDGGESWTQAKGLNVGKINSVVVDPNWKCTIYVSLGERILKTVDCCRTWNQIYKDTRAGDQVVDVLVDPNNRKTMYAALGTGEVIKSLDEGLTWKVVYAFNRTISKLIIGKKDKQTVLLAATDVTGLFRSTDGGIKWDNLLAKDYSVNSLALSYRYLVMNPLNIDHIYWLSLFGILQTKDGGNTWTEIKLLTPPSSTTIYSFAVNYNNEKEIYYTTATTFYKTVDGGTTWNTKNLMSTKEPSVMKISPVEQNVIYIGFVKPPEKPKNSFN